MNPSKMLFVGLYEGDLVAFRVVLEEQNPTQHRLQQLVLSQTHGGAIRTMRSRGPMVVSGGADGRIVVANLEEGTCWSVTLPHEETANTADYSACGRFLFVGGAERSVFYVDLWQRAVVSSKRNAHRQQVEIVRVWPPTGRIMVTVGQDRVRFWDLTLHHLAAAKNSPLADRIMDGPITCVEFSSSGNLFIIAGANCANVISVTDGHVVRSIPLFGQKPIGAIWFGDSLLALGLSSGWVVVLPTDDDRQPNWQRLHESGKLTAMAGLSNYVATTTNTSEVTLWELRGVRLHSLCGTTIAGRATCLVMVEVTKEVLEPAEEEEASPVVIEADSISPVVQISDPETDSDMEPLRWSSDDENEG